MLCFGVCFSLLIGFHTVSCDVITLDMSYQFEENVTIYWFKWQSIKRTPNPANGLIVAGGYWLEDYTFCAGEHGGTHIDAPRHVYTYKDAWTIEQIPLDNLLRRPVVKIDISSRAAQNKATLLMKSDLELWEGKYGQIPERSAVFMYSGWGAKYPNRTLFLGIENDTRNVFPGFHPDAVEWLGRERKAVGIGVDTASLDYGLSQTFRSHINAGRYNMWGAELVANMDQLPEQGALVSVLPMKTKGGSGAPSRIFATWPTGRTGSASDLSASRTACIAILATILRFVIH